MDVEMTITEDVAEEAKQLLEPFLVVEKRRGRGKGTPMAGDNSNTQYHTMDLENNNGRDDGNNSTHQAWRTPSTRDKIRVGLILAQWGWPALVNAFWRSGGGNIVSDVEIALLGSIFFLSLLVGWIFYHGEGLLSLQIQDYLPTVFWVLLFSIGPCIGCRSSGAVIFLALMILLPCMVVLCLVLVRCKNHGIVNTCTWLCTSLIDHIILPNNRSSIDCFKQMEEEYVEQLRQKEATEQTKLEVQQQNLQYLKDVPLSKPPISFIYVLLVVSVWTLIVIGRSQATMDSIDYETKEIKSAAISKPPPIFPPP